MNDVRVTSHLYDQTEHRSVQERGGEEERRGEERRGGEESHYSPLTLLSFTPLLSSICRHFESISRL